MDESLVQKQSFEFALSMIRLYKKLQARQEFILSSQLLKSGTRIGATVEAALAPWEHAADGFTDRSTGGSTGGFSTHSGLQAAAKQARETRYWLKLLQESRLADVDVTPELQQIEALIASLDQLVSDNLSQTGPA